MAEAYGIFDYRHIPVQLLATLTLGLRDDSRVKMAISGISFSQERLILAAIADYLAVLVWSKTKDGQHNRNRPKSLYELFVGQQDRREIIAYSSPEEFEKAREKILRGEADGN